MFDLSFSLDIGERRSTDPCLRNLAFLKDPQNNNNFILF
jgi:hypothetical protein